MLIKGNSIQNGIPSPDNPAPIENEIYITDREGKKKKFNINLDGFGLKEGEFIFRYKDKFYVYKQGKGGYWRG